MIRSAAAVAAGLLCGLYGIRSARRISAEARDVRRWCSLLARLDLLLAEGACALPEALLQAADDDRLPDMLVRAVAQDLQTDPLASLPQAFEGRCPPCPGRSELLRLFSRLGRGSADSRRLAIRQCADLLAPMASQAEERAAKDARLFRTLGWCGGVSLTLLLL